MNRPIRRGVPSIARADLRDHADGARVDRIWSRIEGDLAPMPARPTRAGAPWLLAAAAVLGAFGGGLYIGRGAADVEATPVEATAADADEVRVDVCAAGETPKSCALPGGGQIEVKPHTIVEVAHTDGQVVTLRLLQGEADITSSSLDGLAIVAGEMRMATQAGSVVNVRRNDADVDVSVSGGLVDVSSPDGRRRQLRSGDREDRIPLSAPTASLEPKEKKRAADPVLVALEEGEVASTEPAASDEAVAPEPREDWTTRYDSNDWDGAIRLAERDHGSLQAAIAAIESPERMAAMADLADLAKQSDLARATRIRVIERWPHSPQAQGLAYQLGGEYYERYKAQLEQVLGQEQLECQRLYNYASAGDTSEAAALAARGYLKRWPTGQCRDDAEAIVSRFDASRPGAEGAPGEGEPEVEAPAEGEGEEPAGEPAPPTH